MAVKQAVIGLLLCCFLCSSNNTVYLPLEWGKVEQFVGIEVNTTELFSNNSTLLNDLNSHFSSQHIFALIRLSDDPPLNIISTNIFRNLTLSKYYNWYISFTYDIIINNSSYIDLFLTQLFDTNIYNHSVMVEFQIWNETISNATISFINNMYHKYTSHGF